MAIAVKRKRDDLPLSATYQKAPVDIRRLILPFLEMSDLTAFAKVSPEHLLIVQEFYVRNLMETTSLDVEDIKSRQLAYQILYKRKRPFPTFVAKFLNLETLDLAGLANEVLADTFTQISRLPALRRVFLCGCELTNIVFSACNLPVCEELDLSKNLKLTSLTPLEKSPNLTSLNLSGTLPRRLDSIIGLTQLQTLSLSSTFVENQHILSLRRLTNLTDLTLSRNPLLSSLDPLEDHPKLSTLAIVATQVKTLPPFPVLTHLNVVHVRRFRLESLVSCPSLTHLFASHTFQTTLAPLKPLKKLELIEVIKCTVSETDIVDLLEEIPDAMIVS